MANHADNAQVKSQAKGSTGKKVAIAVVAILGVIVVYCALLVGSVLQAKKHTSPKRCPSSNRPISVPI